MIDPVEGGVQILDAWFQRRQFDKWFKKLVYGYGLSWFVTFTGTMGATITSLVTSGFKPTLAIALALGAGLTAGAGVLITMWYRDPDLKGTMLTLRQDLKQIVPDPGDVTITRPK